MMGQNVAPTVVSLLVALVPCQALQAPAYGYLQQEECSLSIPKQYSYIRGSLHPEFGNSHTPPADISMHQARTD